MTDVTEAVPRAGEGADAPSRPPPRTGPGSPLVQAGRTAVRDRGRHIVAALLALVALAASVTLPFAPVVVNEPTVTWPQDELAPRSTLLTLTSYRPLGIDVTFSCAVARAAGGTSGPDAGVVVSTTLPESPLPVGLRVTTRAGRVTVTASGVVLLDEALPTGSCVYTIVGTGTGRPVALPAAPGAAPKSGVAGPTDARLVVSRDGRELVRRDGESLPDVDVLATSITALPAADRGGLSVRVRVDDEYTSSPTPLKNVLTITVCLALIGLGVTLALLDRTTPRRHRRFRFRLPRLVDLLVPAVMVLWTFVAPATDDDGYYAAMAHNGQLTGEVGNYYQLYDQSFTPFTWIYRALGWWQALAGTAPVAQRLPALAFGLLTWLLLRRLLVAAAGPTSSRLTRSVLPAALAVALLAWWVPQAMGVRPESVVGVCGAATLVAVFTAYRRRRLVLGFLAFAVAGLGFTAHPTGFTVFAPLVAGIPLLWSVIRATGSWWRTALRALAVVAGGATALVAAFADGALRDFLRGQAAFLAIQDQDSWATEITRYAFLLGTGPMGNFAKRSAILVCIVALVWFAVLAAAARGRRVPVPTVLWFAGASTALAFAALWLTPSKWTHHFGALSGVGATFLALFLVMGVPLLRRVVTDGRIPVGILVALAGSFVVAIALAWHGPNIWPYAWLDGVRLPLVAPSLRNVPLGTPAVWVGALILVIAATLVVGRLRGGWDLRLSVARAVPVVVAVSLLGTAGYTVVMFANAARHQLPVNSVWARNVADPTGALCGSAAVINVLDPATAAPLTADQALGPPSVTGFVPGGGYYRGDRPQTAAQVWGSLQARGGASAEATTGTVTTSWYRLPAGLPEDARIVVLAAGTLGDGNSLTARYGGDGVRGAVTDLGTQQLTDTVRDPAWRTLVLRPPPGARLVQLTGVDATAFVHGWLGFSAPQAEQPTPLARYIPARAPVALGWQTAFDYPCLRAPDAVDGITEPVAYSVTWGNRPLVGLTDNVWNPDRGGLFGQVPRTQSILQLATVDGTDPNVQVYAFSTQLATDAYRLATTSRTQSGADIASGTGPSPAPS